jgi:hypothetical protein
MSQRQRGRWGIGIADCRDRIGQRRGRSVTRRLCVRYGIGQSRGAGWR